MILDEHLRFLILNSMLNGYNDNEIISSLHISEGQFANLLGFKSYKDYLEITCNTSSEIKLQDIEKLLLNIFSLDYYCCAYLVQNDGRYIVFTLNQIRDNHLKKPYTTDILENIILDVLPSIKEGKTLEAIDGIMTIPREFIPKLKSTCVSAFKKYAYGDTVLNRTLFNKVLPYFDIVDYTSLTADICKQLITYSAKNGYRLCVLNQLVKRPIVDYLKVYQNFKAIIKVSNNVEKIMILTHNNNSKSKTIELSSSILSNLAKTPTLFESCMYDDGYIMILTNAGYRPLILHEEVSVY